MKIEKVPFPRRHVLRFSLRGVLLLTLAFCVVLGWKVERARRQRNAVRWVERFGGCVFYDYQLDDNGLTIPNAQLPAPVWLMQSLGVDFFDDVVWVSFTAIELRNYPLASLRQDTDLSPLADLTSLKWLYFFRTPLSDVTSLTGLTKLEELQLSGTQVRDVTCLSGLSKLEKLHLGDTQVRDVTALSCLASLTLLDIRRTPLADVTPLGSLTNLKELLLSGTQVGDVSPLVGLTKLKTLTLDNTPVSVGTLRHLKEELPQCVFDLDVVIDLEL